MKVLLIGTSLLPSYGGPAVSVSRLAISLAQLGIEVGLWAPDGSAAESQLLSNVSIRRLNGTELDALDSFGRPDIIHDNGVWLPHNHEWAKLAASHKIPRMVSVRGMVEPWAIKHKRIKKALAWSLYQRRDLRRADCHHATAETEAENLRRLGLGVKICVIPNGVDVPKESIGESANGVNVDGISPKTALFLGRIHPVKGLPMLVEAWARVRPTGWCLQIAGPDEAGHQKEVEQEILRSHLTETVSFIGSIDGARKREAFLEANLFVLPSHSESFGMVVAEALAHGLPVLTTAAVPWGLLREENCGWSVEPSVEGLEEGLRRATAVCSSTLREMGARGRSVVSKRFDWQKVASDFVTAYSDIGRRGVK